MYHFYDHHYNATRENFTIENYSSVDGETSIINNGNNESDADSAIGPNDCIFGDVINVLHIYYIPILITVGLIGNLTSVFVFMTTHLKLHSSSYYLASLAIVEFLFVVVLSIVRCSFNSGHDIFNVNGFCQFFVYVSSVCTTLSAWLIVAFTVERFIAVQYPLQRPHICTVSRAKIIVTVLALIGLLSQSYIFWTAGIIRAEDNDVCEMRPEYKDVMTVINIFDTILTLIGPTLLIIVMNVMIARNIYLFKRRIRMKMYKKRSGTIGDGNGEDEDGRPDREDGVFLEMSISKRISSNNRTGSQQSYDSNSSRIKLNSNGGPAEQFLCMRMHSRAKNMLHTKSQQNITKVLLLVSTVFIILNFPSYVIRLLLFFFYHLRGKEPPRILWCLQQLSMVLFYTNYSINFLLYAMCGATFRRCLWQLIKTKFLLHLFKLIVKQP